MARLKEKIKKTWISLTYPYGLDKEYDEKCDIAFIKFLDNFVTFCWCLYIIVASISIYFLITRELL